MTNQELFDQVAIHLLTQNAKSLGSNPFGTCAYRGNNGLKCAAGIFIPDDRYRPELEGNSVTFPKVRCLLQDGFTDAQVNGLLRSLQSVHDTYDVSDWSRRLRDTAVYYKLDPSVVTNFSASVAP